MTSDFEANDLPKPTKIQKASTVPTDYSKYKFIDPAEQ